ncbi:hypothetical protein MIND_01217700 [Mycena indigotica]|uniref:DUF6535 domain-containing protein n=1 Tax=Mycena indigotica TaxID=2126181 RepID=A0A8H6S417_9AGAR|nr:uncharacterized protein MIND_01217700 [Mycena indigotica]KAF7291923.1 hypothetical protein MIND_01217700 [Mycena indigotica]
MPTVNNSGEDSFYDRAEEAGAAKLWSVYVDEAERYDKSLVASWKSDMEGMLIFAGLFSASLTAFLIESYKTLNQDPGDAAVHLLEQILIVSSGSNSTSPVVQFETFKPSLSSLVCNALWFISLGLSLSCALVATLLEQWARDFLHRANIRSSPIVRARIYSYLYYGLRRYKMHAVVETIPSLLHASLLFFFGGLIAFLLPVNKIIAGLVGAILVLVLSVYVFLTIFPLFRFNSPYRTPLSNTIWGLSQSCTRFWRQHRYPNNYTHNVPSTIVDNIIENAVEPSESRQERDTSALIWTMRSMSDDTELQTFVEAIPDAMWGPKQYHRKNVKLMTTLRDSAQVNLPSRIADLWRSCADGLLLSDAIERRETACLKAFWALCSIPTPLPTNTNTLPGVLVHAPLYRNHKLSQSSSIWSSPYFISMKAMASWSGLEWLQIYLAQCYNHRTGTISFDSRPIRQYIFRFFPLATKIDKHFEELERSTSSRGQFDAASRELGESISLRIFFDYLRTTATSKSLPYRWQETLGITYPRRLSRDPDTNITDNDLQEVELVIDTLSTWAPTNGPQVSAVMRELCRLWRPQETRPIPSGIISYLKRHGSAPDTPHPLRALKGGEVRRLFDHTGLHHRLWRCFPATIALSQSTSSLARPLLDDVLMALWIGINAIIESSGRLREPPQDAVVQALTDCTSPMAPVVLLAVKTALFRTDINKIIHSRIAIRSSSQTPDDAGTTDDDGTGKLEAAVIIIVEFLEKYAIADAIDALRAVEALRNILELKSRHLNANLAVHHTHQTRFAHELRRLAETSQVLSGRMVVQRLLDGPIFDPPESTELDRFHWITEPAAQADLRLAQSILARPQSETLARERISNVNLQERIS